MKKNVGSVDQWIRWIIGLALILWGVFGLTGTGKWVAIIIGLIPIITASLGWCPLYQILGLSTQKK